MPALPIKARRLELDTAGYDGFHVDFKASPSNADKRALLRHVTTISNHFKAVASARADEREVPTPDDSYFAAANEFLATFALSTNIDTGPDGQPLPAPSDPAFWDVQPDAVVSAATAHVMRGFGVGADGEANADAEDFPKPS